MKEETKETIDYAAKKLDTFFAKVVTEGGELTSEFVEYALLELHIGFAIAVMLTIVSVCCLIFLYMHQEWVISKLGDAIIPVTIVSVAFMVGGTLGVLINGYDIYMSSKFPLMWVISNKVM